MTTIGGTLVTKTMRSNQGWRIPKYFFWLRRMRVAWLLRQRRIQRSCLTIPKSTAINPNSTVDINGWTIIMLVNKPSVHLFRDKQGNPLTAEEYFKRLNAGHSEK